MTQLPTPPSQFSQPTDVVSTLEELARLDIEYEKWSGREKDLHLRLNEEFSALHDKLYGTDALQTSLQDLLGRIDEYRQSLGNLNSLSARTEGINKQMIKSRREKEEQRREKIRQESVIKLKRSRNALKEVARDLICATRLCLSELATVKSQNLLSSIHSENSLNEIIDQNKLNKICADDAFGAIQISQKSVKPLIGQGARTHPASTEKNILQVAGELLSLVVAFQELMRDIAAAKAVCSGQSSAATPQSIPEITIASQAWLEELELFDDVDDDTEAIIKESFMICKILIVRRFELIIQSNCDNQNVQRIPRDLIQLFSQTRNFNTLVKLVIDATPPKVLARPALNISGHQTNYYYDQMLEVTNLFKRDIDRYYYIIYGSQDAICQPQESWLVFESLLLVRQEHASAVYGQFHQELFNNLRLEQLTVKDIHPWLHESLLICSNALSIQKSIRKIVGKIDGTRSAPSWLDIHEIRADLIKLVSVYLQKAWESAKAMDDCGLSTDTAGPSQLVTAQQSGSTMVDDIFYVIKEVTQQRKQRLDVYLSVVVNLRDVDILDTYKTLIENILHDIPMTLESNAIAAMEIWLSVFLKHSPTVPGKIIETVYTPVCVRDLMLKSAPSSSVTSSPGPNTGATTINSARSFPHALHSLRAIQAYAAQVQEQLRSPPNTPSATGSPNVTADLELRVVSEGGVSSLRMSEYYQNAYGKICDQFTKKLYDGIFAKQICITPISAVTEAFVMEKLNLLHQHIREIWGSTISGELLLYLLRAILSGMEKYIVSRADDQVVAVAPTARESFHQSAVSVLGGVFAGGSRSNELTKTSEVPSSTEASNSGPIIDFSEALAIDALVRHLLEWADENLVDLEFREDFQYLLEICELITVDAVTDILDLSTSTQWHLEEDVAVKLLRARKDMQRYTQLDHVLNLLVTSGVFKKSVGVPS